MLIYYEIKGLIFSFIMALVAMVTLVAGWGRQPSESPPPIGYGAADITDSDK